MIAKPPSPRAYEIARRLTDLARSEGASPLMLAAMIIEGVEARVSMARHPDGKGSFGEAL